MIALTAVVVASVTLMLHKQQDNALLLQRINSLKTENAGLREQVRQFTAAHRTTPSEGMAQQPADMNPVPASGEQASDS